MTNLVRFVCDHCEVEALARPCARFACLDCKWPMLLPETAETGAILMSVHARADGAAAATAAVGNAHAVRPIGCAKAADCIRVYDGDLVTLYECPDHGFVAWASFGLRPRCRDCRKRIVARFAGMQVDPTQPYPILDAGNGGCIDPNWRTYRGQLVLRHADAAGRFVGWAPVSTEFDKVRSPVVDLPYDHISQVPPLE